MNEFIHLIMLNSLKMNEYIFNIFNNNKNNNNNNKKRLQRCVQTTLHCGLLLWPEPVTWTVQKSAYITWLPGLFHCCHISTKRTMTFDIYFSFYFLSLSPLSPLSSFLFFLCFQVRWLWGWLWHPMDHTDETPGIRNVLQSQQRRDWAIHECDNTIRHR